MRQTVRACSMSLVGAKPSWAPTVAPNGVARALEASVTSATSATIAVATKEGRMGATFRVLAAPFATMPKARQRNYKSNRNGCGAGRWIGCSVRCECHSQSAHQYCCFGTLSAVRRPRKARWRPGETRISASIAGALAIHRFRAITPISASGPTGHQQIYARLLSSSP